MLNYSNHNIDIEIKEIKVLVILQLESYFQFSLLKVERNMQRGGVWLEVRFRLEVWWRGPCGSVEVRFDRRCGSVGRKEARFAAWQRGGTGGVGLRGRESEMRESQSEMRESWIRLEFLFFL